MGWLWDELFFSLSRRGKFTRHFSVISCAIRLIVIGRKTTHYSFLSTTVIYDGNGWFIEEVAKWSGAILRNRVDSRFTWRNFELLHLPSLTTLPFRSSLISLNRERKSFSILLLHHQHHHSLNTLHDSVSTEAYVAIVWKEVQLT